MAFTRLEAPGKNRSLRSNSTGYSLGLGPAVQLVRERPMCAQISVFPSVFPSTKEREEKCGVRIWGLGAVSIQILQSPAGVFSLPSNERGQGRIFLPREGKCGDLMGRCDMGQCWGRGSLSPLPRPTPHLSLAKHQAGTRHQSIFSTQSCRRAGRRCRPGCMVPTLFPQHPWNTFCIVDTGLCAWGGDL